MPYGICEGHYKQRKYINGVPFDIVSDKKIWRSRKKMVKCSCGKTIMIDKTDLK